MKSNTLTKFTSFYEGLFNNDAGIKISLPAEFNDPFDAQLRFSDQEINNLANEFNLLTDANIDKWLGISNDNYIELNKFIARKPITPEAIKYYIQRLQTTHILCLNSFSALDFNTSHMWGIYANNGKGVALEFSYSEIENRFNYTSLKSFLCNFYNANDKDTFLRSSLNEDILCYIKEVLAHCLTAHKLKANDIEDSFLKSSICLTKEKKLNFLEKRLNEPEFSTICHLSNNLIPITYNSRFDTLIDIFKTYLI